MGGFAANPEPPLPPPGKPARKKQSKALNLLIRLGNQPVEIMGFCEQREVPYDNNPTERDSSWMMKVREKISCTFRSGDHGLAHSELHGIISSAREQSRAMLGILRNLVNAPETLGAGLAAAQNT